MRRQVEAQRRQVGELRCSEQKWQRQVDTIGEAVTALGGQVPLGCELHLNTETVSSSVSLDELTVIISTSLIRLLCFVLHFILLCINLHELDGMMHV